MTKKDDRLQRQGGRDGSLVPSKRRQRLPWTASTSSSILFEDFAAVARWCGVEEEEGGGGDGGSCWWTTKEEEEKSVFGRRRSREGSPERRGET